MITRWPLVIFSSLLVLSCGKKEDLPQLPSACFQVNEPVSGEPEFAFAFTNCSEGAERYHWDFGDGDTSTARSPTHTYEQYGTYEVTLWAMNATGPIEHKTEVEYGHYEVAEFEYEVLEDIDPQDHGSNCESANYHVSVDVVDGRVCIADMFEIGTSNDRMSMDAPHVVDMETKLNISALLPCTHTSGWYEFKSVAFSGPAAINLREELEYRDLEFTSEHGARLRVSIAFELVVAEE